MGNDGPAKRKSYEFALAVVRAVRLLQSDRRDYVLSKQLLRSGTSIGANVAEAGAAQTKKDFIAKMAIASKEARETHYWLSLLKDSSELDEVIANELIDQVNELIRLLTAIVKTSQTNNQAPN